MLSRYGHFSLSFWDIKLPLSHDIAHIYGFNSGKWQNYSYDGYVFITAVSHAGGPGVVLSRHGHFSLSCWDIKLPLSHDIAHMYGFNSGKWQNYSYDGYLFITAVSHAGGPGVVLLRNGRLLTQFSRYKIATWTQYRGHIWLQFCKFADFQLRCLRFYYTREIDHFTQREVTVLGCTHDTSAPWTMVTCSVDAGNSWTRSSSQLWTLSKQNSAVMQVTSDMYICHGLANMRHIHL